MRPAKTAATVLTCLLLVVSVLDASDSKRYSGKEAANAFRAGYEYVFQYDSQIALGLVEPNPYFAPASADENAARQPQKAATRFQCQVKIAFDTDSQATLRVEKPRIGEINAPLPTSYAQRVQPMKLFQRATLDTSRLHELGLPARFTYVTGGIIDGVKFDAEDSLFSKNIKRAILNLVQVNLKPASNSQRDDASSPLLHTSIPSENLYLTKSYTTNEVTMEGDCEMTYSINSNDKLRLRADNSADSIPPVVSFNVSKTVDFARCKRIADVGFDAGESARIAAAGVRCFNCMKSIYSPEQQFESEIRFETAVKQCERQCSVPRNIDSQAVDRSTVMRYVCSGRPESGVCALKLAELQSRYIFKSGALADYDVETQESGDDAAESATAVPSELAAIALAKLEFIAEKPLNRINVRTEKIGFAVTSDAESLMFDNSATLTEKLFFMYGDAEFQKKKAPFADVKNKVEQSARALQILVESSSNPTNGIEANTVVVYMPRLVHALRMASIDELDQIKKDAVALVSKQIRDTNAARKTRELFADMLAICGTKNTIDTLFQMIENREISIEKAVHSISIIGSMTPSSVIIKKILQSGKSELAHRHPAVKQACILSASALIGNACSATDEDLPLINDSDEQFQKTISDSNEKIDNIDACSANDKQYYAKALLDEFEQAESLYEKILALKAIGNAALLRTLHFPLKKTIRGQFSTGKADETLLLRIHAIDALRRMSASQPLEIQRLLMPIYANAGERDELRMSALAAMLLTKPDTVLLNNIVYMISTEHSHEVKAFTYLALKSYANTQAKLRPEMAQQLRDSIFSMDIINEDLVKSTSSYEEKNIFSSHSKLLLGFSKVLGAKKAALLSLPTLSSIGLNSVSNGPNAAFSVFDIQTSQIRLDNWVENVMKALLDITATNSASSLSGVRGQRGDAVTEEARKSADEQLRAIFSTLGIKKRVANNTSDRESVAPITVIVIRIADFDRAVLPLDEQKLSPLLKTLVSGERLNTANVREFYALDNSQFNAQMLAAVDLDERSIVLPTTIGVPLRVHHSSPIFSALNAETKFDIDAPNAAINLKFNIKPSICVYRIGKLETETLGQSVIGVESMRTIEAFIPIKGQLNMNTKDQLKITLETPKVPNTRLFGLHTLTATYTKAFDAETQSFLNAQMRAVHSPQLDIHEVEINEKYGEHSLGLPLRVTGHFHMPPKKSFSQSLMSYMLTLTRVGIASENHLHVVSEPTADTPREFIFRAEGSVFEKISTAQIQNAHGDETTLRDFYVKKANRIVPADSQSQEESENKIGNFKQQNEKLNSFLSNISKSSEQMYKHAIKLGVESSGGRKQTKAEARFIAFCDASFKLCKLAGDVKRTPILASETEWWTLKARADVALPETVSSYAELVAIADTKNQELIVNAKSEWGPASTSDKQLINIRIQGERQTDKAMEQMLAVISPSHSLMSKDNESSEAQRIRRKLSFINSFGVNADYKISSSAQNFFRRVLECLEANNYWNSIIENVANSLAASTHACLPNMPGPNCKLHISMKIEPISQKYANLTIRAMNKLVHMETMLLPKSMRGAFLSLIKPEDAPVHSMHQLMKRGINDQLEKFRAKCVVGGQGVKTFDGLVYNAKITKCYTVLAKDCAAQKFSVLMKSLDNDGQQKKIKIITPDGIIECQPNNSFDKKLMCKKNGETITSQQTFIGQSIVEYNNEEQTMVRIYNSKAAYTVKFACECEDCTCQKASIHLDKQYKNTQCGICGHYDDDKSVDSEFLKANNEKVDSDDLHKFIRSYTLYNDKKCPKKSRDEEIEELNGKDVKLGGYGWTDDDDTDDITRKIRYSRRKVIDTEHQFISNSFNAEEMKDSINDDGDKQNDFVLEDPELRTRVMEYNHQICFSVEAIKECAEGSTPKTADDLIQFSESFSGKMTAEQLQQRESGELKDEIVNVKFTCLPRSSPQTRRMQKEAKRGVTLTEELTRFSPNYLQKMTLPIKCLKYIQIY